jgi:general secretion pathway protein D
MNKLWKSILLGFLLISSSFGYCENDEFNLSISELLDAYTKSTSEKIVASEKVFGKFNIFGVDIKTIKFAELLTILDANGFTAYKSNGYTIVIPVIDVRSSPIESAEDSKEYPLSQYVTAMIKPENACALKLIPMLRPLVKKYGHMSASFNSNTIVVTDSYSNIKRIREIIHSIDSEFSKTEQCKMPNKT